VLAEDAAPFEDALAQFPISLLENVLSHHRGNSRKRLRYDALRHLDNFPNLRTVQDARDGLAVNADLASDLRFALTLGAQQGHPMLDDRGLAGRGRSGHSARVADWGNLTCLVGLSHKREGRCSATAKD